MIQQPRIREDGLQLEERRSFHRSFWTVERWAWAAFGVILLLVLAGATGSGGWLARTTESLTAGRVEYPRVARWESSDEVRAAFAAGGTVHRLVLDRAFFEYFEIEGMRPEPERTVTTVDGTAFEFAAEVSAPTPVVVYLRPLSPGMARYRLILDGGSTELSSVILP